jgi:hypothetical protein
MMFKNCKPSGKVPPLELNRMYIGSEEFLEREDISRSLVASVSANNFPSSVTVRSGTITIVLLQLLDEYQGWCSLL